MKRALLVLLLVGFVAAPAAAQGRGKNKSKVPPGHLPPAGACRVWYDGVPPGRQPAPTSCAEAERIASRQRNARVIYGNGSDRGWPDGWGRDDGRWERDDDDARWGRDDGRRRDGRLPEGRAVPRTDRYPGSYPYPDNRYPSSRDDYGSVAFRQGYEDGVVKGREDTRDGDSYDPARHSWYRSANRGYNSRYGSREQYAQSYRDGFLQGYRENYRGENRSRSRPSWWPF